MKIETRNPIHDGRYIAYVPGLLGWLEPVLVLWHNRQWQFRHSGTIYDQDKVRCWIGPLPVVNLKDLIPLDPTSQTEFPGEKEFDL